MHDGVISVLIVVLLETLTDGSFLLSLFLGTLYLLHKFLPSITYYQSCGSSAGPFSLILDFLDTYSREHGCLGVEIRRGNLPQTL